MNRSPLAGFVPLGDRLKQHAGPLIPDLVAAMARGVYIPTQLLIPVIARLKSPELLKAGLAQNDGNWPLSTFDKSKLLEAGFLEFQAPLLDELFQIFEHDGSLERAAIVKALAASGTASALEVLQVIEYRTAARIPEIAAESDDAEMQMLILIERGEHPEERRDFLKKVRAAITAIGNRPDPLPIVPPDKTLLKTPDILEAASIDTLLKQEESQHLEFKAALRWDHAKATIDTKLERRVLCSITSFANAAGGTLLIGVDPEKHIVGLQNDYSTLKGDHDGFERHLKQLISSKCDKVFNVKYVICSFRQGICRVDVRASSKPVFLTWDRDEEFWVRNGNANVRLEGKELTNYVQQHFTK